MSDLDSWLQQHDLGKYADLFVENEVKLADLPELTEEDMKELGLPLGPRKRLLKGIRELVENGVPEIAQEPPAAQARGEAERRQLTVMFCDLVGSVELGERMALEDYRDLLAQVREAAVAELERYRGFVARHQGDGILAYFGYPTAREDDAERAVHAGLALIEAVGALDGDRAGGREPTMRVGIATGPAIVGDVLSTGSSDQSERAALGTTPNLAARLQGEARPGELVVSDTTRELCRASFEFDSSIRGIKGMEAPVGVHRVLRATGHPSRLDITSGRTLTPLAGREAELALLVKRWEQARAGEGQVVLVSAEPGIGKTRMMMEAHRRFGDTAEYQAVWFCSPYHTTSALHPVVDYLNRTLGGADRGDERLPALERWLDGLGADPTRTLPLLAPLLGLVVESPYRPVTLEASEQRRRTLALLAELMLLQGEGSTLLLAVEDLHWVDPTTEALLGLLTDGLRQRAALAMLTFRPEYTPPFGGQPHLTTLSLNHLTGSECMSLVKGLPAGRALPDEVVREIVERTDGVPLFLEELARSVVEAGTDGQNQIPATLRDALTARLDRLGESKRVAQLAAVIGRVFPWPVLAAAGGLPPDTLRAGLDRLVASGLAYRRTLSGEDDYAFKHALVRDCAYQSLLREECQALHRGVADALEAGSSTSATPELIARHWTDGAEPARALPLWRLAGEEAQRRGAFNEALGHFEAASACLDDAGATARERVEIALARAECLHFLARRGEALDVLGPHADAVVVAGDASFAGRFFASLGRIQAFGGLREASLVSFGRAIDYARLSGDSTTAGIAHAWIARERMFAGDFIAARNRFARAVGVLEGAGPSWDLGEAYFRFGMLTTHYLIDFPHAHRLADKLTTLAGQLDDLRVRCNALVVRGHAWTMAGDWARAEDALQQLVRESPNEYERVFAVGFLAELYLERGDPEAALPLIEEEREKSAYRSREVACQGIYRLARARLQQGRFDEARAVALEALRAAEEAGNWRVGVEVRRLLGRVALHDGDLDTAREQLGIAADLAAGAHAPAEQALVQQALAELHHREGEREASVALLGQALDTFRRLGMAKHAAAVGLLADSWGSELTGC
jgi:class 3 adenylate cyclase/tetratricopeptide (TPR) repeat protein